MVDGESALCSECSKMARLLYQVLHRASRHRVWIGFTVAVLVCVSLKNKYYAEHFKRPPWMEDNKCFPRTNIAFLKTHKCASSAIQNILLRYGDTHNLIFALPDNGNYLGRKVPFNSYMVQGSPLNKITPNIFTMHTKWNYTEIRKVMPPDTVYFTIVREPSELFSSLFVYARMEEEEEQTMEQFIKESSVLAERTYGNMGFNQMTWDFGLPLEDMDNLTAVNELVKDADEQFGLVLVSERMEESLVLLAKYLCWDLKDVLVLKVNSLVNENKKTISGELKQILQQKLTPDYLLYNHFLAKFEQLVEAYGRSKMAADVERLRELMSLLNSTCYFVSKEATKLNKTQRPWSDQVNGFEGEVGGQCGLYTKPELIYIDLLRNRQMKRVAKEFGIMAMNPLDGAVPLKVFYENRNSTESRMKLQERLLKRRNNLRKNFINFNGLRKRDKGENGKMIIDDEKEWKE